MQATDETAENNGAASSLSGPQNVEVKGWRNGLLLTVPLGGDWDTVLSQVDARLDEARARSFWRGAQVTLVCGARPVSFADLSALCERIKVGWGLVPIAVAAADANTRAAGEKLALVSYEELPVVKMPERRERDRPAAASAAASAGEAAPPAAAPAPPTPGSNALYVQNTVRSGQRIVHDGHVVICGDVNAGAEVIAGGDVLVFGTLRGLAHAGSMGNEAARIVAVSLRPPQLRIAQKIARAPEEGPKTSGQTQPARTPEVARIENGEIGVFPL